MFLLGVASYVCLCLLQLSFSLSNFLAPQTFAITGVPNWIPDEPADKPFRVFCHVSSSSPAGVYAGATTRSVVGHCANVILPAVGDVLALDLLTGRWASSLASPTGSGGPVVFSLSLSTSTPLAIIGDARFLEHAGPYFSPSTLVSIGGVRVPVLNVSLARNGPSSLLPSALASAVNTSAVDVIVVESPAFGDVCASGSACEGVSGYKTLVLETPGVFIGQGVWNGSAGGAVSCPPHCPGQPGAFDTAAGLGAGGVYYTPLCVGFPSGAVCMQPAIAGQCAYGEGDTCAPCPRGALCPGGDRCWCVIDLVVLLCVCVWRMACMLCKGWGCMCVCVCVRL